MRIGLFTDAYLPQIGGVSTSTALLQRALKERGHLAFVITGSDPDQAKDEVDVFRVPSLPFVSAKRLTLGLHPLLAKQLKSLGIDIVHSQTEFGMGLFARQFAKQMNIPHVHTFHTLYEDWLNDQIRSKEGGIYQKFTGSYVKSKSRRFCNKADRIIVPTPKTKKVLLDYGVTRPIDIIPTGINLSGFQAAREDSEGAKAVRDALGIKASDKMLLYLGRISREKHIDEPLHYLKRALQGKTDVHFVLVGDGPAREELTKAAEKSSIAPYVHFVGPVPWSEVPRYYAAADIFISASQSETQGLTYMEALAAGVPILVRSDPAIDDVVQQGINGYTFVDESSFFEKLDKIVSLDSAGYKVLSDSAYESARPYSVDQFADSVLSVYEEEIAKYEKNASDHSRTEQIKGKLKEET